MKYLPSKTLGVRCGSSFRRIHDESGARMPSLIRSGLWPATVSNNRLDPRNLRKSISLPETFLLTCVAQVGVSAFDQVLFSALRAQQDLLVGAGVDNMPEFVNMIEILFAVSAEINVARLRPQRIAATENENKDNTNRLQRRLRLNKEVIAPSFSAAIPGPPATPTNNSPSRSDVASMKARREGKKRSHLAGGKSDLTRSGESLIFPPHTRRPTGLKHAKEGIQPVLWVVFQSVPCGGDSKYGRKPNQPRGE